MISQRDVDSLHTSGHKRLWRIASAAVGFHRAVTVSNATAGRTVTPAISMPAAFKASASNATSCDSLDS